MIDCEFDTLILSLVLIWIFYVFSFNLQLSKKYKLNKELIIYSWANDEATREYKISLKQIQLLSELGIELKIIHYNI